MTGTPANRRTRRAKTTAEPKSERPTYVPPPEDKAKASKFRIIAGISWAIAIVLELFSIFWVLNPPFDQVVAAKGFPTWRWVLLIVLLVVIAALAMLGSWFWKRSNRLDPASREDTVRFFVQNQLGAIVTLIAFVPLIVLIFLDKDMSGRQKGIAGGIGIVLAVAATLFGVDFKPMSKEQKAVESQVVTQLVGKDEVWWTGSGKVAHLCEQASDIKSSTSKVSGTIEEALSQPGFQGITLKLTQELNQCDLPVPDNLDEIIAWVQESRGEKADASVDS